jgi:hypothetical protein
MDFEAFHTVHNFWDPIVRGYETVSARFRFPIRTNAARDGDNVLEITLTHDEVDEKFPLLLQWCMDHKCLPHYIRERVVPKMSHKFTLACPSRDIQLLAKLTWGGNDLGTRTGCRFSNRPE